MEKVVDLFKSFRNKEIEYDELFGALTKMLSEDPHFSVQAVATLDKAQQQTPIPVTDFINLRAKVENTAATFHQQETSHGTADSEATMIFAGEEALASPGDPTLMASSAPAPIAAEKTPPPPTPVVEDDYADEATVIMPMAPRQASAPIPEATPIPATSSTPTSANEEDEHATLIATPPPSSEPTPVPVSPAPPSSPEPAVSEPAPAKPAQTKVTTKKPPILLIGAGAAALVVILIIAVLWPSSEETTTQTAVSEESTPKQESSPWGQEVPAEVLEPQVATDTNDATASAPESLEADTIATDTTEASFETPEEDAPEEQSTELSVETIELEEQPQEPIVKDEAYFMTAIQNAIDDENLGPAENEGTATYFLVELIKINKESEKISEARTLISKKHLELAKKARSNNQWDAAQKHLDDALKVRLPDSYLPE